MSRPTAPTTNANAIRSFIAVNLDRSVLQALTQLRRDFAATGADVRWVRPEGMHLTLKFLGGVDPTCLERVQTAVVEGATGVTPISLRAKGLGAFPSLRRPSVVWAGLQDQGQLQLLAERIESALELLDFARESRAFHPHVTLGRVNSQRGWAPLGELIESHIDDELGVSTIREVIIYQSTLQRGGSVYTPLWTIPLTENRGTG